MNRSLAALAAVCLSLPACIPDIESPDYSDDCENQSWWQGEQVEQIAIGSYGLRNLVHWQRGSTGNAAVVSPTEVLVARDGEPTPFGPDVLVAGDAEYLHLSVVGMQLVAQRLDRDGAPIGDPVALGTAGELAAPRGIFDGERYWVVWRGTRNDGDRSWVSLARVGRDGARLDAEPIVLATESIWSVDIAGDGDRFWVVWQASSNAISGVRIDGDGTVLDADPVPLLDSTTIRPRVVARGDEVLLVAESAWGDRPLKVQRLGLDGSRSEPVDVGYRPESWRRTDIKGVFVDPTRDGYLLVAERYGSGNQFPCTDCTVEAFRLDADGTATDDGPFAAFPGGHLAVSFNGVHPIAAYVTHAYDGDHQFGDRAQWEVETRAIYLDGTLGPAIPLDGGDQVWTDGCAE